MRLLILIPAMAMAFFTVSLPSGGDRAEARSLLERLFPGASRSNRARRERRRAVRRAERRRSERRRAQRRADRRRASERRSTRRRFASRRFGDDDGFFERRRRTRDVASRRSRRSERRSRRVARNVEGLATVNRYLTYRATPMPRLRMAGLASRLDKKRLAAEKVSKEREAKLRIDRIGRIALAANAVAVAPSGPVTLMDLTRYLRTVRVNAERDMEAAITTHYTTDPRLIWLGEDGRPNAKARDMAAVFAAAANEGLRASDYALPQEPGLVRLSGIDVVDERIRSTQLNYEFAMTARALRYLRDARHGRIAPDRISTYHDFSRNVIDFPAMLKEIATSKDPSGLLLDAHPKLPQYKALRAELIAQRNGAGSVDPIRVRAGTFLKPGWSSDQLPEIMRGLRRKASPGLQDEHAEALESYDGGSKYTRDLVKFVRGFQREQGLGADGIIGRNTLARLNDAKPKNRTDSLLLAMERLRWHPDSFGRRHVFINAPEYRARYIVDGDVRLAMNVVVGRQANQTNFFHDEIEYVEFNPYWNVPNSIMEGKYLGNLQANPNWGSRRGYDVVDWRGRVVNPNRVDWWRGNITSRYRLRQRPGGSNALGELKIMFPNRHAIYMHDTPSRHLFARQDRAYSHGCIRLADPRAMAAAVLNTTADRIGSRIRTGKNNQWRLKEKVPVFVAYFTAWPKADGTIGYHADIYGRDRALLRAIRTTDDARAAANDV